MNFRIFVCCSLLCFAASSSCNYKGTVYGSGSRWVAEDRCNMCTCQSDGAVFCETKNCTVLTCHDNNRDYQLGETYKSSDGCNQCICTINGAVCTLMSCMQFGAGTGHTHIPRCYYHGRVYTVGDAFATDACNHCICTEKETLLCTEMFCPPSTVKPPETTKQPTCVYNGKVYSVGDTFKSSDGCNTCNCAGMEQVACTEMFCPPSTMKPTETTKEPTCAYNGKVYYIDDIFNSTDGCNTCNCDGNGQVACTEMFCLQTTTESLTTTVMAEVTTTTKSTTPETPAPILKCDYNGRDYSIGDGFKADDGCNTCKCTDNGQVACTLLACPPTTTKYIVTKANTAAPTSKPKIAPTTQASITCDYNGKVYSIGDSFKANDGCNTCKCLQDGKIACTKMFCQPTTVASSSTALPASQEPSQLESSTTGQTTGTGKCNYNGHAYSVGDNFNATDGCNTCRCTENLDVACTKMYCPKTTKQSLPTQKTTSMPIDTTTDQSKTTSMAKQAETTVQPIETTTVQSKTFTTKPIVTTTVPPVDTTTIRSETTSTMKPIVTTAQPKVSTTAQPKVSTTAQPKVSTIQSIVKTTAKQLVTSSTQVPFPVTTINHLKMTLNKK